MNKNHYKYLKYKKAYDNLLNKVDQMNGGDPCLILTTYSEDIARESFDDLLKSRTISVIIDKRGLNINDFKFEFTKGPTNNRIIIDPNNDNLSYADCNQIRSEYERIMATKVIHPAVSIMNNITTDDKGVEHFNPLNVDQIIAFVNDSKPHLDMQKTIFHLLVRKGFINTLKLLYKKFSDADKLREFYNLFTQTDIEGRTVFMIATHAITNPDETYIFVLYIFRTFDPSLLTVVDRYNRNALDWYFRRGINSPNILSNLLINGLRPSHPESEKAFNDKMYEIALGCLRSHKVV